MKLLVTGHRKFKLESYDIPWIKNAIHDLLFELLTEHGYVRGYAGMASGADLWFCQSCVDLEIPFVACVPFAEQSQTMGEEDSQTRERLIQQASEIRSVKNSWMVEEAESAMVVWDGNKGGTHNVVQQLIEKEKPFYWINPVSKKTWKCL